jgi:hypothetical protein
MPAAGFTHTVRGFFGEQLTIVAYAPVDAEDGGAVEFLIRAGRGSTERTASAHVSSPAEREALMRALMEAYRIADGEKPATEATRAACGQCNDGLVEAKGCNCGSPADASVNYAHERLCGFEPCPNGCWEVRRLARLASGQPATETRTEEELHAAFACPGWEYASIKLPPGEPDPFAYLPMGDGWERNAAAGRDGLKRVGQFEEAYWRRAQPATETAKEPPWARGRLAVRVCEVPRDCRNGPEPHAFKPAGSSLDPCCQQPSDAREAWNDPDAH